MLDSFFPVKKEKPIAGLTGLGGGSILSTSAAGGPGDSITNGVEYESGGYTYFIFICNGSFQLGSAKPGAAAILIGGGGGGAGGIYHGAGAGAGGVAHTSNVNIATGTYTVTVGFGGCGCSGYCGSQGNNTTVSGPMGIACAFGGGAAGGYVTRGCPGGSGGGTGRSSPCPLGGLATQTPQPAYSMTGYGCPGTAQCPFGGYGSGGGGGAGGTSPSPFNPGAGGPGGAGRLFPEFPCALGTAIEPFYSGWSSVVGTYGCYAGGGGGGSYYGTGGGGGSGGGGPAQTLPRDGQNGTGGGGGAFNPSHTPGCGGNGGNGIAIFRWLT